LRYVVNIGGVPDDVIGAVVIAKLFAVTHGMLLLLSLKLKRLTPFVANEPSALKYPCDVYSVISK
jgi:hypothetical protein